jgi:hypothetical protein
LAQVDAGWAVVFELPPNLLPDDGDEYLSHQPQSRREELDPGHPSLPSNLMTSAADFHFPQKPVVSNWRLQALFAPLALYVFMSLQI